MNAHSPDMLFRAISGIGPEDAFLEAVSVAQKLGFYRVVAEFPDCDSDEVWRRTQHIGAAWTEIEQAHLVSGPATHRSSSIGDIVVGPDGAAAYHFQGTLPVSDPAATLH